MIEIEANPQNYEDETVVIPVDTILEQTTDFRDGWRNKLYAYYEDTAYGEDGLRCVISGTGDYNGERSEWDNVFSLNCDFEGDDRADIFIDENSFFNIRNTNIIIPSRVDETGWQAGETKTVWEEIEDISQVLYHPETNSIEVNY